MSWRRQLPVFSPVAPRSLVAGLRGVIDRDTGAEEWACEYLRQRYEATDALLTDSGTSALVLVLRRLVGYGGTVAYPGYGCIDLTAAALRAGVRVRLYDLDPATLSPDLASVRKVIERGVDAIVVAHLYGYPADVGAVTELAMPHGIPVIEDAAQAAGGLFGGKRTGALADVSILSFGRGKGTTAGSGGAVLVRTPALAQWTRVIGGSLGKGASGGREIGVLAAQWVLARPSLYRIPASIPALKLGEMVYRAAREPRAISAGAAAILRFALEAADAEVELRRARAAKIVSVIGAAAGRLVPIRPLLGANPGYLRFALLDSVGDASPNDDLGVLRGYPMTLEQHAELQPVLESRERAGSGAAYLRDNLLTAPTHSRVRDTDLAQLSDWLADPVARAPVQAWAT